MEKEIVEKTVDYKMGSMYEESYMKIKAFLNKPLKVQKYLYQKDKVPKHYNANVIVEKEDRVSIAYSQFILSMGTYGGYIRRSGKQVGATYHKSGRSSSRIKIWSGVNKQSDERINLIRDLTKKVRPDALDLVNNHVIRQIGTNGMFGYILSGNIKNTTEAMEYYIRYSLRGLGIKQDKASLLYGLFNSKPNNWWTYVQCLRVAKNPDELIYESQSLYITRMLDKHGSNLCRLATETSEKIDWAYPEFDPEAKHKELTEQSRRIGELLELWDGGPILRTKAAQSSHNLVNASSFDDLPF